MHIIKTVFSERFGIIYKTRIFLKKFLRLIAHIKHVGIELRFFFFIVPIVNIRTYIFVTDIFSNIFLNFGS